MLKISRESEINLINVLIDHDIISGKDLPNIKKVSTEKNSSQIDAVFELKLTDENKILDVLVKEQNLDVIDLTKCELTDEIKAVLPSNYIKMNFVAPFKVEGKNLHIAISDSSKLGLMRKLKISKALSSLEISSFSDARIAHKNPWKSFVFRDIDFGGILDGFWEDLGRVLEDFGRVLIRFFDYFSYFYRKSRFCKK